MWWVGPWAREKIENRFFHKSLKLYPDARAFSGEHCGSCFAPKKVWRPLSSSRQNSRKIRFLWWTKGDPWAGPPHSNGEYVNLARYMTICSCEMKIKVFISLRNIQPRFNLHMTLVVRGGGDFWKKERFRLKKCVSVTFYTISLVWCVVRSWIKVRWVSLILSYILNT